MVGKKWGKREVSEKNHSCKGQKSRFYYLPDFSTSNSTAMCKQVTLKYDAIVCSISRGRANV